MGKAGTGIETRRGRKRKINDEHNATVGVGGKRKVVHTRSFELVGRYVQKDFKGTGVLLGKIVNHNSGVYMIIYEDGRCEDVISRKIKAILVEDSNITGEWTQRKESLNELLSSKDVNLKAVTADDTRDLERANPIVSSSLSAVTNCCTADVVLVKAHNDDNDDINADSSSDLSEGSQGADGKLNVEVSPVPPPELPPSSGHIGIPEEYVSHLLSVYSFLRSFSIRLFLYPFELDDFVGALNCSVANTLLDSVHLALMCFLKRQFEKLSPDGSKFAPKAISCLDWSLFDTLTWPVYLVHYIMAIGCKTGDDLKDLYAHCLEKDYYTLSVGKKLIVLQILCDNVLDTEELRVEMDMREASEVGMDIDTICEPGYSKSSMDIETRETVEKHSTTDSFGNSCMTTQEGRAVEDGYGDECRLCGMDGVLICCDGCPSAYHSRCLGLNKMPNDSWHCPECKVNASYPKFLQKTTLRGGDAFGVDPYEQVFVASCDHLLVLETSINSRSCRRYYNRHDIPGVINALYAKPEYAIVYSEICKGLMQYWEFSADILPSKPGIDLKLVNKESSSCVAQLINMPDEVPEMTEVENNGICAAGTSTEIAGSLLRNSVQLPFSSDNFFDPVTVTDCHEKSMTQQSGVSKTTMTEPPLAGSLIGQPANPYASILQSNSNITEAVSTRSSNISSVNDTSLDAKRSLVSQELNIAGNSCGSPLGWRLCMGSSFSRTGYTNLYLHGDFSASAAANLAILSHEENQISECQSSENHKKVMCGSIELQVKSFASAAVRFFWPNVEKKLAEVPRERCSWCFTCKASVASKRACLLNAAALNAASRAMKVLNGIRPLNNGGDDRLFGIRTYIIFMEERLSGLLLGPFLNDTFRKQWRRQLEMATTCSEIKILLLELEENMCSIAFSRDWMKLVEVFSTQSSTSQIAVGSSQKCRPGRRSKKQTNMVEVVADDLKKKLTDFTWWRGGVMPKLMFQRGILPSSVIQKQSREGGKKQIPGVCYVVGNEIPRISRQLVWRSTVEISRTVPHLALQVRYLDVHVRWGDIGRPELMTFDGKSLEAEASAFRNAYICGKKIVEQEVRYCVAFDGRKHLPSRVMKNISEIEQILEEEGKERYWFSETFIPLYLIREYEQKIEKNKSVSALSKLHQRKLKASRENIFSSLLWKQSNAVRNCFSCHKEVFSRNAVKCHACQVLCHLRCATTSTVNVSEGIDLLVICKQCCKTQVATQVDRINVTPTNPLLLQGQVVPNAAVAKDGNLACCKGLSTSFGAPEHSPEVKSINRSAVTKKTAKPNWGLIWRKKNCEDSGFNFRSRNILLKGNADRHLIKPVCHLCDQPYNADLMYIRCDACKHWFHADAVELDESKVFSVVGFKCCRCRRIKSPVCPHTQKKDVLKDKIEQQQGSKLKVTTVGFNRGMILDHHRGVPTASELPAKAEFIHVPAAAAAAKANNTLLASPDEAMQCTNTKSEGNSERKNANPSPGPMKLPVRRHVGQEKDILPFQFEANAVSSREEMSTSTSTSKETNTFRDEVTNVNGKEPPECVTKVEKNSSSVPGNGPTKVTIDQEGLLIRSKQIIPCKFCSITEPRPDLTCQICGLWIHKTCSPWFESSSHEDVWRCGGCRDWC